MTETFVCEIAAFQPGTLLEDSKQLILQNSYYYEYLLLRGTLSKTHDGGFCENT